VVLLKLAHVLLAIVALGGSLTFPVWRRRAEASPEQLAFTIRSIRWMDSRIVIPAYALLALTGVALAVAGAIPLTAGWLVLSIALYALATVIGLFVLGPTGKRQLALLASGSGGSVEYARVARSTRLAELVAVACLALIAVLMVLKPF
jgi:uncharacterized membrane protein